MIQFKGRYGKLAKWYGPDATYDAVKSFFAKEIARAAEELRAQNPDHQGGGEAIPEGQSSRPSRRPLHLDDEDISIMSERDMGATFNHPLQAPAKRRRVFGSSQPPTAREQLAHSATVPDRPTAEPLQNGQIVAQPTHTRVDIIPPVLQGSSSHLEPSSSSANPIYIASEGASQRPAPLSQRPSTTIQALIDSGGAQSPHLNGPPTSKPESFGYVTDQGEYRCALCFIQVISQEALDKHESKSKLHLRNLKDAFLVSKGRAKLAQVTTVPNLRPRESPLPAFRPLEPGDFGERGGVGTNGNTLQGSTLMNGNVTHNEHTQDDSTVDMIILSSPPSSSSLHIGRNANNASTVPPPGDGLGGDKGKRRACPPPVTLPAPQRHPYPRPEPHTDTQSHPDSNAQTEIGTSTIPNGPQISELKSNRTQACTPEPTGILRSTWVRLARYIENHPELIAQLMGAAQCEAAAAAAVAAASPSSAPMHSATVASTSGAIPVAGGKVGSRGGDAGKARREMEDHREEGAAVVVLD